jgi:hypothetical protein
MLDPRNHRLIGAGDAAELSSLSMVVAQDSAEPLAADNRAFVFTHAWADSMSWFFSPWWFRSW